MNELRDLWNGLDGAVARTVTVVLILIAAVLVERMFIRVLRRAYWRRVERAATARGVEELSRVKRQKTLVTLLESFVRYGVYGAAIVVMLGVATRGGSSALFSFSLVIVLVGFGFQRMIGDVVAGALMLFEGHFAVGDVITVHQHNVTGTVEEFSLRTTALRTLGGDRVTVMNGSMASFTRWSYGQREFRIELLVVDDRAAERVAALCASEGAASTALWVRPPAVTAREPVGDLGVRVLVSIVAAPGHDALVERFGDVVSAALGDDVVGPVTIVPLYEPTFRAWHSGLLVRE